MYAIYGNIYHQYTPNVSIYIPYMDPMGKSIITVSSFSPWPSACRLGGTWHPNGWNGIEGCRFIPEPCFGETFGFDRVMNHVVKPKKNMVQGGAP